MQALVLERIGNPLVLKEIATPTPKSKELLVKVLACGICRTDLHIIDGEVPCSLPRILGHQIVGEVVDLGKEVLNFQQGDLIGIPWLGYSCQKCHYCQAGKENLCDQAQFTGCDINGGFATYATVLADYAFPLPRNAPPEQLAPLLCAGMIGYRTYKMVSEGKKLGFYGFGAAAHLLIQLALYEKKELYIFTRPGDVETQKEALEKGAIYAGDSTKPPPEMLDGAILFAPVGDLVPLALKAVAKGGKVVSAGIHMSDIPSFPYSLIWGERSLSTVANLTRKDGEEFLKLALSIPIKAEIQTYPFEKGNDALQDMRDGKIKGSAVLLF